MPVPPGVHPRMDALALCVPLWAPEPPYYAPGPVAGMVRLVGYRWRPCPATARILGVAGAAWPHRAAAIDGLRRAMLARHRRYMLRTVSYARLDHRERMVLARERLERRAAQADREAA